jgi:hypothetical protein
MTDGTMRAEKSYRRERRWQAVFWYGLALYAVGVSAVGMWEIAALLGVCR